MGVIIDELEVTLSITPQRLYKSFILDIENFVPKAIPFIKNFKCIEGDGGVGTIKLVTYVEGDEVKTIKHKVEEVDEANYVYKYTVFEGDIVDEDIQYFTNTIKIDLGPNEGSVYKYTTQYYTKNTADNPIPTTQHKIKQRRERTKIVTQSAEAYLLAHPHLYV